MKRRLFITILFIFSQILFIAPEARANVNIYDIKIGELNEAWVNISWSSSEETTGYIVFGETADNLKFYVGDRNLSRKHSADMTGLKKNQDYYFKIVAVDKNGRETESFLNYLDTEDMKDGRETEFSNFKKILTTDTYFVASFSTDEKTKIKVLYGEDSDNLDKYVRNYHKRNDHRITIKDLKPNTRYHLKIIATDEDAEVSSYYENFRTSSSFSKEIKIDNLRPISSDSHLIAPEQVLISFNTNHLAKGTIYYGTDPKRLNKRINISSDYELNHQALLKNLLPNTTYFYQIKLRPEVLRDNYESSTFSFQTSSLTANYLEDKFQSGDLVKHRSNTYFIYEDNKIPIYSYNKQREISSERKNITESHLSYYKEISPYWGELHEGQVAKKKYSDTVYLIKDRYKRPIANWEVLKYLNYQASDIVEVKSHVLSSYKDGALVSHSKEVSSLKELNNTLVKSSSDPAVYLLVNDKKLPFLNETAFLKYGYKFSNIKNVSDNLLNSITTGHVII